MSVRPSIKGVAAKTLIYRVLSFTVIQLGTWVAFRRIEFNAVVLFSDIALTTPFYFIFELLWRKYAHARS